VLRRLLLTARLSPGRMTIPHTLWTPHALDPTRFGVRLCP